MKKYRFIFTMVATICTGYLFGQDFIRPSFEKRPPLRKMKCGLWMNSMGDIAHKIPGCEVDEEETKTGPDSLMSIPNLEPSYDYITWAYDIRDTIPEDISEEDFVAKFTSELKNVVDTASFKILSPYYFTDKNYVYIHPVMVCSGPIFVAHNLDRKTFKVFNSNPDFACDKNHCYIIGREIEGADPKTFRVIKDKDGYTQFSRDKKHVYNGCQRMSEAEIDRMEKELEIKLRK